MSNIYQIQQDYLLIMQEAEDNDGLLSEESNKLLEINKEEWENKANQYCKILKNLDSDINFGNSEIERINKYINTKLNLQSRLKQTLLNALLLFGEKDTKKEIYRYSTETFKLNSTKRIMVEIDEELIDDKWKEISIKDRFTKEELTQISDLLGKKLETSITILKTPIKEAIENKEVVEGAVLVDKFSLTVK